MTPRRNVKTTAEPALLGEWSPWIQTNDSGSDLTFVIELPMVDPKDLRVEIEDRTLSLKGYRKFPRPDKGIREFAAIVDGVVRPRVEPIFDLAKIVCQLALSDVVDIASGAAHYLSAGILNGHLTVAFRKTTAAPNQFNLRDYLGVAPPFLGEPFPIDFVTTGSPNSRPPEETNVDRMLEDDRIITREGIRYLPLALAASVAQAHRTTLLDWVKKKTKFDGKSLDSYYSPTAGKFYVTEESAQRVANRFVKWPSNEPAGRVTIGETKARSGYLPSTDAARIVGVSSRTMWLWARQGNAPIDRPLDVVKCTSSDHFYVRESDVYDLKDVVPRSGLQRGRRPQPTRQP